MKAAVIELTLNEALLMLYLVDTSFKGVGVKEAGCVMPTKQLCWMNFKKERKKS